MKDCEVFISTKYTWKVHIPMYPMLKHLPDKDSAFMNLQYIPINVLCCGYTLTDFPISIRLTSLALWQSNDCPSASKATLMNMDKYFMWIHYERLYNHNKAKQNKTVCIFLGIYCIHGGSNNIPDTQQEKKIYIFQTQKNTSRFITIIRCQTHLYFTDKIHVRHEVMFAAQL